MVPPLSGIYGAKEYYDKAEAFPNDNILARKILGENHQCRWINWEEENCGAIGCSWFYPSLLMNKNKLETQNGLTAHELCHLKNNDGLRENCCSDRLLLCAMRQ